MRAFCVCASACWDNCSDAKMRESERRQSATFRCRKRLFDLGSAAISGTELYGLAVAERNERDVFFWHTGRQGQQSERIGDFFADMSAHRLAGIDKNGDLEFGVVRTGKALEIADDKTSVDDRKIIGLQSSNAVVILVSRRKSEPHLTGARAVGKVGLVA